MASKKNFKKDINFLTSEIITRCYIHLDYFCGENQEPVYDIMKQAVDAHNDYISRLNAKISDKSKKEVKKYFNAIYDDLLKSTDSLLETIDNLDV